MPETNYTEAARLIALAIKRTGVTVKDIYDEVALIEGNIDQMDGNLDLIKDNTDLIKSYTEEPRPLYPYGSGVGEEVRPRVDSSTDTLQFISYSHHEIHSGSTYRVQNFNDAISSSGTVAIGFDIKSGETKLPHMLWDFVHEGDMTITVLEGVTLTTGTGTDVAPKNSRRDSTNTSVLYGVSTGALVQGYVTKDPSFTGGSVISLKRNYAAKGEGSSGSRRQEVILKPNTSYIFQLTNNEATAQGGQVRLEWYEHTDKH